MRHGTILVTKLAVTAGIYATALPFLGLTLVPHSLILAAVTTLLLWLVGDQVILPRFGTVAATAANGIMALLLLPAIGKQMGALLMPRGVFVAAAILAAAEWLLHGWMVRNDMAE